MEYLPYIIHYTVLDCIRAIEIKLDVRRSVS